MDGDDVVMHGLHAQAKFNLNQFLIHTMTISSNAIKIPLHFGFRFRESLLDNHGNILPKI